jgi:ATP-binding cassette subfamily B protein
MRFYDPSSGTVRIDGRAITEYNIMWLRSLVGLVSQQPTLLAGTIEYNIRLGKKDATDAEVEAAARFANAQEFIDDPEMCPQGYRTEVGDLGGQLVTPSRCAVTMHSLRPLVFGDSFSSRDFQESYGSTHFLTLAVDSHVVDSHVVVSHVVVSQVNASRASVLRVQA